MSKNDSTARTAESINADIFQVTNDYFVNMEAFFDLVDTIIKKHNNTDFDAMEFLVKAGKEEWLRFGDSMAKFEGESEAHHG